MDRKGIDNLSCEIHQLYCQGLSRSSMSVLQIPQEYKNMKNCLTGLSFLKNDTKQPRRGRLKSYLNLHEWLDSRKKKEKQEKKNNKKDEV